MLWIQDAGQGPPLVLLHPVGTSGSIWWQHIPRLAQRFHVISVDLPGHGRSPKPEEAMSIEGMADALYKTLKNRSLFPAHLVGLSLGGMVAQMLVAQYPSSVVTLTLSDTLCEVNSVIVDALEERAKNVEQLGMTGTVTPTLDRWFAPGFSDKRADVVAVVEKLLLEADPIINAQTWRAIAKFDVASRLKTVPHVKALVVNGSLDTSIPSDVGKCLSERFGARVVELSGCAHMAPVEAPKKFMDILEPFILGNG